MGFGRTTFLFRRQMSSSFVWLDGRLALFSLEAMVLVTQTLSFLRLVLELWRTGFPPSSSDTGPLGAVLHLEWCWDRNLLTDQAYTRSLAFSQVPDCPEKLR